MSRTTRRTPPRKRVSATHRWLVRDRTQSRPDRRTDKNLWLRRTWRQLWMREMTTLDIITALVILGLLALVGYA